LKSKTVRKSYAEFHGRKPAKAIRRTIPNPPAQAFLLGEVREIVYKRPGEPTPYLHKFKRPYALLVSDAKGRHLFLVGGGYRVTARGIVR
jgi:hypothetical protein